MMKREPREPEEIKKKHEIIIGAALSIIVALIGALVIMSVNYGMLKQKTDDMSQNNTNQAADIKDQFANVNGKIDMVQQQSESTESTVLVLIQKMTFFGEQQDRMEAKIDAQGNK